jgi:hypothetical protein
MKHLSYVLFSILCLLPMLGSAQDRVPVTFLLVDGSELEGYVNPIILGAKSFTYSMEPKGVALTMKLEKVKRMLTTDGEKTFIYDVVPFLNSKNDKVIELLVLQLLVDGHMSLYYVETDFHDFYLKTSPNAPGVYFATSVDLGTSFMAKKNHAAWNKYFKRKGAQFFSDCPEIVADIEAGKIDGKDMVKLVERYNEFKAAQ